MTNQEQENTEFLHWKSNKLENLKFQRAIVYLSSGYSGAETAKQLGVSQRTVQLWFKSPEFNVSLRYAINLVFQSAISKSTAFADEAVSILISIARDCDTPARYRIEAIKVLFDICLRASKGTSEDIKEHELRQNLSLMGQYAKVQNIAKENHVSLEKPNLSKGMGEIKTTWSTLYPGEPFLEDEADLREWWKQFG